MPLFAFPARQRRLATNKREQANEAIRPATKNPAKAGFFHDRRNPKRYLSFVSL